MEISAPSPLAAGILASAFVTGCLSIAACEPGGLDLVRPGGNEASGLGTLVARVELRSGDSALANSLGWEDGVPGAQVRILRNGTAEWLESETDSTGVAVFEDLESGQYFTYAERVLTDGEAADAATAVRGFGAGDLLRVGTVTAERTYRLQSSRRTGLVLSEVSGAAPYPWEVPGARTSGNYFFEVYNQSGEMRYLDGLIFGRARFGGFCDGGCANTCAISAPVRNDPGGVYYVSLIQFPGGGSDYPIGPGQTRIVVGAAIDHREIHEDMLDHRRADFEIGGVFTSYADNPSVPNMEERGENPFYLNNLVGSTQLWFLAEPFDPLALPVTWRDVRGNGYRKVPAELLLDVASHKLLWPENDAENEYCDPMIHPEIDGFPGGFKDSGRDPTFLSFQREVLTTRDGIPILMDTNTSASDFSIMRYTPDGLPDGGQ